MEKRIKPSRLLLAAAAVMAFSTLLHLFAGGAEIYDPVRASTLDAIPRSVMSVVWHMVSVMLAVMAVALYWCAGHRNSALELTVLALQIGTVALFLGYTLVDFRALFALPQWTLFLATAGLIIAAKPLSAGR